MVFSEEILVGKLLVNMRIIGGKFKGKNIEFLRTNKTRPLKDSVKENIFNIIAHSNFVDIRLNGSSVLDAYSGVGSFGLECLSRGANFVTFVERDIDAMSTLEKNISNLKFLS
jgi:16S rRNA (guanine966-N2)-methyltransferase